MKNNESGRSLIEMLGVLAFGTVLTFSAMKMYQVVRTRQHRFIAEQELQNLSENARILYTGRRNYSGISKNYLIKAGALKNEKIMNHDFRVESKSEGENFSIIFDDLNFGDCAYFSTKPFDWTEEVVVNNISESPSCLETVPNKLEFIVK